MATRLCFISKFDKDFYEDHEVEFEYFSGFAITQKQKSIDSLHAAILEKNPSLKVLEVSRKSRDEIGMKLSAFNLLMFTETYNRFVPVECVFQSSKVFENGQQYTELLLAKPIDAKQYAPLKESGRIVAFKYDGQEFPIIPRTLFYDWIYIHALYENLDLLDELAKYDAFTDIEFNQNKSLNCQARSCAIAVSLYKQGLIQKYLGDLELFKTIYKDDDPLHEQISLF